MITCCICVCKQARIDTRVHICTFFYFWFLISCFFFTFHIFHLLFLISYIFCFIIFNFYFYILEINFRTYTKYKVINLILCDSYTYSQVSFFFSSLFLIANIFSNDINRYIFIHWRNLSDDGCNSYFQSEKYFNLTIQKFQNSCHFLHIKCRKIVIWCNLSKFLHSDTRKMLNDVTRRDVTNVNRGRYWISDHFYLISIKHSRTRRNPTYLKCSIKISR